MDYIKYLTENVLPFWLDNAIDYKNGGIFTSLDRKGEIYGREKSVWFQGRALYIFSNAYNSGIKNEKYLEAARKIYEFLPKCTDTDGRMFFIVTEDGREIQKRRYYFSETFAAIGCCEYYLATGCEEAKTLAEKYFETAYNVFCNPMLTTPKFNPENAPYKSLSPVMIMLSTAQVLRKIDKEKYDKIAKEMYGEILNGGYLMEDGLHEHVYLDGSFADTPRGRIINPGHSLEAAWFLMAEGIYQSDKLLMETGKRIIDISMKLGLKNGGIIAFCDSKGYPPEALEWDMQLWWPQCEAMIANRLCYEIFKEEQYKNSFEKLREYSFSHFGDPKFGEWYGYLHYDGTVANTLKGNIFKGPFHLPRLLLTLDKIENNKPLF